MNLSGHNLKIYDVSKLIELPIMPVKLPISLDFQNFPNIPQIFEPCPHSDVYLRAMRNKQVSFSNKKAATNDNRPQQKVNQRRCQD